MVAREDSYITSVATYEIFQYYLNSIELKIKKIEVDINKNHETIKEIRDTVRKLSHGKLPKGLEHIHEVIDKGPVVKYEKTLSVKNIVQAKDGKISLWNEPAISNDMCALSDSTSVKTDVQMLNMFDTMKFENPDGGVWKQGWAVTVSENKWKDKKLKVFVVPHTHNDPGWIKTYMDYYKQQTRQIFENMLPKLEEDHRRKFIYAEISFFSLWWDEIDAQKKKRVKNLIERKQLEIVTGGWVMNDEANTHYFAMVDQMIEGHQWLNGTLGVQPNSGWAIDPFGHSSTMAYLLKKMGLKNMLIQRIHYAVKKQLAMNKQLEFMWRQEWDQRGSTDIMCHMMPFYSYDIPHTCGPDPAICCQFDFARLPGGKIHCPWKIPPVAITDGNVDVRAKMLLDQYRKKSELYRSHVVLAPLGDDFRYDRVDEWDKQYKNYQKIFDHWNAHPELNVEGQFGTLSDYFNAIYEYNVQPWKQLPGFIVLSGDFFLGQFGTLSDYFNAIYDEYNVQPGKQPPGFPVLSGDFFTYADRDDNYWSGYYTSRPFYKNLDRLMEYHMRSAEIIFSLAKSYAMKLPSNKFPIVQFMQKLIFARRNLGLFQHHDGITGTAKDFVVIDYGERLIKSMMDMKRLIVESATYLAMEDKTQYAHKEDAPLFHLNEKRETHDSLPVKNVLILSDVPRPVMFYNSLAHERYQVVKVYTSSPHVQVKDVNGKIVLSQVDPFWTGFETSLPDVYKVSFLATVPALGISTYTIERVPFGTNQLNNYANVTIYNAVTENKITKIPFSINKMKPGHDFSIDNSHIVADFSSQTGLLKSVTMKGNGKSHKIDLNFVLYGASKRKEKSGAYLFLPDGPAKPIDVKPAFIRVTRGPVLSEVEVYVNQVEHKVRVYNSPGPDGASLDIDNLVDIRLDGNKELAMRFKTDIKNNNIFFTDLNGFQMQKRRKYDKLPLQANFYPMPSMAYLEDSSSRMSVMSAQSLGVASLNEGEIEVMLDRRLNQDDNRGLAQGVTDNKKTPNRFWILFETKNAEKTKETDLSFPSLLGHVGSLYLTQPIFVMPKNPDTDSVLLSSMFSPLVSHFPCEIHLLNLRSMQNKDDEPGTKYVPRDTTALLLHRLGFDCQYPNRGLSCQVKNGKLKIGEMFKDIKMEEIVSTSLSLMHEQEKIDTGVTVQLDPMELYAYIVKMK